MSDFFSMLIISAAPRPHGGRPTVLGRSWSWIGVGSHQSDARLRARRESGVYTQRPRVELGSALRHLDANTYVKEKGRVPHAISDSYLWFVWFVGWFMGWMGSGPHWINYILGLDPSSDSRGEGRPGRTATAEDVPARAKGFERRKEGTTRGAKSKKIHSQASTIGLDSDISAQLPPAGSHAHARPPLARLGATHGPCTERVPPVQIGVMDDGPSIPSILPPSSSPTLRGLPPASGAPPRGAAPPCLCHDLADAFALATGPSALPNSASFARRCRFRSLLPPGLHARPGRSSASSVGGDTLDGTQGRSPAPLLRLSGHDRLRSAPGWFRPPCRPAGSLSLPPRARTSVVTPSAPSLASRLRRC
ncbi:hypothetical protein B0H14DRAFT_2644469 [Mycena olivaceomarginata]|nr:hypothetical protein B0H14DRAFT_2644469 [Mycena olivaceomarginata]